jgi:hypothetical protein
MILAMSVGTPVVGYFDPNWGSKNPGTLGQFDMPFCYIEEDNKLYNMIKIALENQDAMKKKITQSKEYVLAVFDNKIKY